jgi:hypothetical protein
VLSVRVRSLDAYLGSERGQAIGLPLPRSEMNWRRLTLMGFFSFRLATPQLVRSVLYDGKVDVNGG